MKPFGALVCVALSAALFTLPYHFGGLYPLGFIAFVPYFFSIRGKNQGQAFKYSMIFGGLFWAATGFWLNNVNTLGFLGVMVYLACYVGFFGYYAVYFLDPPAESVSAYIIRNTQSVFFVPALWVFLEYARGFLLSGLPWSLLAYTQWKNLAFIQGADVVGAYGISFAVMAINVLVYRLLLIIFRKEPELILIPGESELKKRYPWIIFMVLCVFLGMFYGYGTIILSHRNAFYAGKSPKAFVRVATIQGNIPQDQKWDVRIKYLIFEKYRRLTLMAANDQPDLIVWPETSFPGYLENEPIMAAQLRNLVRQARTGTLVGAPTMGSMEEGLRFYNSAIFYTAQGEEQKRYHKMHLVPFGEYVPLEPATSFIRNFFAIGRFTPGKEKTLFKLASRSKPAIYTYGVLICYEDIFPLLVRDFAAEGADFLVNITNDAWFGKTSAPYQHAQASVFRAVENHMPVVRAGNTGLSCLISSEGKIYASVKDIHGEEIMVSGHKTGNIIIKRGKSFFTRFGDLFFFLNLAILLYSIICRVRQGRYSRL